MRRPLAALVAVLLALPAFAADKLPADLALVPGNATLLVHIKAAEVWKSDLLADTRAMFDMAGAKAVDQFDNSFTPPASTIDRVTIAAVPDPKRAEPVPVLILAFNKPFDAAAVRQKNIPKAEERKANGHTYFAGPGPSTAIFFADESTLIVSDGGSLPVFLEAMGKPDGPMKSAVEQAVKAPFLVAVHRPGELAKSFGLKPKADDPPAAALKAERVTLAFTFDKKATASLAAVYATADDAKAGEAGLKALAKIGRELLGEAKERAAQDAFGWRSGRSLSELPTGVVGLGKLGWVNATDELLATLPVERTDNMVTLTLTPSAAVQNSFSSLLASASAIEPAYSFIGQLSARRNGGHNLKRIGLAMHEYESNHSTLPPAAICDKEKTPLLSWRVALLPYLGEKELYDQFKLDEPWDSEHNKKLIEKMPAVYADPRGDARAGETYYKVFVGKNAGFDVEKGRSIVSNTDGTSNTLMAVSAGPPVPWTKPADIEFDPLDKEAKLPALTRPFDELVGVYFDGRVRVLNTRRPDFAEILRAIISPSGGEIVSLDDY